MEAEIKKRKMSTHSSLAEVKAETSSLGFFRRHDILSSVLSFVRTK